MSRILGKELKETTGSYTCIFLVRNESFILGKKEEILHLLLPPKENGEDIQEKQD